MITNFFKTAYRNLKRQKGHFFLNLIGLTVGMVSCLLILLYVQHELGYDRFNLRFEDIYRVQASVVFNGIDGNIAQLGGPVGPTLVRDYPEVEAAVRFWQVGSYVIQRGDQSYNEGRVGYTDPSFFDVFSIPLLAGNREQVLKSPHTMVISETMAKKYFGDTDPVGEMLLLDNKDYFQVQGVYEDIPDQSHFRYDFLLSFESLDQIQNDYWLSFNYFTYVLLREGTELTDINSKFTSLARRYCGPEFQQYLGSSFDEILAQGNALNFYLEPIERIHLHTQVLADIAPQGDFKYVLLFTIIALFILLIACFNFINLATARATTRAREVALRKVVGAPRFQIMLQFLTESLVISTVSMGVAIILSIAALPYFNQLSGKQLSPVALLDPVVLFICTVILLLTSVGAGLYPAFVLSAFKPVSILRDKLHQASSGRLLRNVLVVFQFSLSVILLVSTLVVYLQLQYIQNKKLGFEREHVLLINDAFILGDQRQVFKNKCQGLPEVQAASFSSYLPVPSARNSNMIFAEGALSEEPITIDTWSTDEGYIATMDIKLIQGRNFRAHSQADSLSVLVNEAMVARFGWKDPVGKTIKRYDANIPPALVTYSVVGVIRDFHYLSMRSMIQPLALFNRSSSGYLALRLNTEEGLAPVEKIKRLWEEVVPGQPFSYTFMSDRFAMTYREEMRIGNLFTLAACIAVVIGCLGLIGLAAFIAERKTKEIGIRKVLGATGTQIVLILTKRFTYAVLVANLLGLPLAWFFMRHWLDGFAYRIEFSWWIFAVTGLVTLVIAWLTVGYQAVRAGLTNPAKSLKCE